MKKKGKNWKREVSRDLIALGSIPFFILVLARVWILEIPSYFYQFLIAGAVVIILFLLIKSNLYSGLALVILFFTANFYNESLYTTIGGIAYLLLLGSLYYLKYDWRKILWGVLAGAIGILVVYLVF